MARKKATALSTNALTNSRDSQSDKKTIPAEDADTISAAMAAIQDAKARLGEERIIYLQKENAALNQIAQAQKDFQGALASVARKLNLDLEKETWVLDMTNREFSRKVS